MSKGMGRVSRTPVGSKSFRFWLEEQWRKFGQGGVLLRQRHFYDGR